MISLSRAIVIIAAVAAVTHPAPAQAWDYPGHRIVGAIADLVLAQHHPKTQARVSALLEKTDSSGVAVKRSLSEAAVFPDCAKRNNEPFCGRPSSDEEKAYAARNKHHDRFHYTDVPLQEPRYLADSAGTGKTDVVHMINYIVAQLSAKTPEAKPARIDDVDLTDGEALWLLAHLVGDIHQPLHVGAKYYDLTCKLSVDPNQGGNPDDRFGIGTTVAETVGGNLIFLEAPKPAVPPAANLHFYWDGAAVARAMRIAGLGHSEQEFARLLAATPPAGWQTTGAPDSWATQWATEILPLAVEAHGQLVIHKGDRPPPFAGTGGCTWTTTLDSTYEDWATENVRRQLAKAGFRLAALLVAIFEGS
jgi:S1/P1 Nuclease